MNINNQQLILKISRELDLTEDSGIITLANFVQKIVEFEQKYPYSKLLETCNSMEDINRIIIYADADYCSYT